MENIIEKFNVFTENPVKFLTVQSDIKDEIKILVKSLYDYTKSQEKGGKKRKTGALPELIVQDFDEEQIWQQIELQNNERWDELVWEVANCMSLKDQLKFPITTGDKMVQHIDMENSTPILKKKSKISIDKINEVESNLEVKTPKNKIDKIKKKIKPSIVDDKFFKLQEMEQFLLNEERNEGKNAPEGSDDESIDLFEDLYSDRGEEDEEARNVKYSAFFDQADDDNSQDDDNGTIEENYQDDDINDESGDINDEDGDTVNEDGDVDDEDVLDDTFDNENDLESEIQNGIKEMDIKESKKSEKKVRFADASSDDDESGSDINDIIAGKKTVEKANEKKSDFEMRQERLKQTIDRLENKTLNEAPWQLKGEVDASKRPQNSLLEEVVDFDLTSRPAPIITEQTTLTLEDIIRQRIKDKAWDDVQKKEKPVDDQLEFRKTEILDHAKSQLSLAQVYEAEYLKQKHSASGEAVEEKEPEAHTQIRDSMRKLFEKLDALCHYHYTPKAAQAEVKIVSNTPAISMEEVAPVATSDATLLAPEEVKRKGKGELMTKEERTQTDKNRERRKKKKFQHSKGGQVTKVTDHRNTKKVVEANDKTLKTSKAFFQQLNDDATSLIKANKNVIFGKNKAK